MSIRNNIDRHNRLAKVLGAEFAGRCDSEGRVRDYVLPKAILWQSEGPGASVENPACLLENRRVQITLGQVNCCWLRNRGGQASVLLDFGRELNGGVQILAYGASNCEDFRLRVRFGESAMEAMSDLGGPTNATNDHAVRDTVIDVISLAGTEFGNTGFRFVRIDLVEGSDIALEAVRAVFVHRDIEYKGSFECSDPLLNRVWSTGAYTVFLNMQCYLWDGIKRDRLVWIGDMHPETSTIQAVFGHDPVVPDSLDLVRDTTPLPGWMNGFPSYSMWWVLIQHGWYLQNGDMDYLREQKDYLMGLMARLEESVGPDGSSRPNGPFFTDWPSSPNGEGVATGVHALHAMSLRTGAALLSVLGEGALAKRYEAAAARLQAHPRSHNGNKQAGALMALAGMGDAQAINESLLAQGGAKGLSSFYGYYMLQARALAGDVQGCLDNIREYWGGMLSLGATSFWEDFDVSWLENAARIDELTPAGLVDVHGSYGGYCYKGYRHSLCHGWASGPTAWLSEHVLGIKVVQPGCRAVRIQPALGDLAWARGKYPTPFGEITVSHEKLPDGTIQTVVDKPDEVTILS